MLFPSIELFFFIPYLIFLTVQDIRRRMLPGHILLIGILVSIFLRLGSHTHPAPFPGLPLIGPIYMTMSAYPPGAASVPVGLLPGFFCLLISRCSRGALGSGDALLLLSLGIVRGFWSTVLILFTSLLCASLFSSIMLYKKKFTRHSSFPFVPFLMIGYIGELLIELYL